MHTFSLDRSFCPSRDALHRLRKYKQLNILTHAYRCFYTEDDTAVIRTKQGEQTPMSFTADEIQSLNDILDRKLTAHRREMERAFDQRIQTLRHDMEHRLDTAQREIIANVTQKLADQHRDMQTNLG